MSSTFDYNEFITRNIGFVTPAEQERLRKLTLFVPGVGGMGGVAVEVLARMGVEKFSIADIDTFEVSNINRQPFATLDTVGKDKASVVEQELKKINPNINVKVYGYDWTMKLDAILPSVDIVINGCDDVVATIILHRKCKEYKKHSIDAFAAILPNVYVIDPGGQRPEEALGFPTAGKKPEDITEDDLAICKLREIEHVLINSSSIRYIDAAIAEEIISGKRKRISFAPMVWITGCMMAYEVTRIALGKPGGPGVKGIFFNPWSLKVERPRTPLLSYLLRKIIRKKLGI
jgi:molybdopterin-synthase adenylyltransferase